MLIAFQLLLVILHSLYNLAIIFFEETHYSMKRKRKLKENIDVQYRKHRINVCYIIGTLKRNCCRLRFASINRIYDNKMLAKDF